MSMKSEPTLPAAASSLRRRWRLCAVVVTVVVLALAGGVWLRWRLQRPEILLPDLDEVDPEVAEAIHGARDEVLRHPSSAPAWGRLGQVLLAHDIGPEATRCLQEAERLDPREPRWPYLQGLILVLEHPDEGILCLERAVARAGNAPVVPRLRLAEALLNQGRLDQAQSHLDQALAAEPDSLRARLGLGRLALQRGDWRAGLEQLHACLSDVHARRLAHSLCSEAWNRLGQPGRARAEQDQAAELPEDQRWRDPFAEEVLQFQRGLRSRIARADALAQSGQLEEAIALLDQTVAKYPKSLDAWMLRSDAWRRLGRMDRAEESCLKAVQAVPDAAEAWFRLGYIQALSRPRQAAESFRRAIALKPDHTLAHYNLGYCLGQLGDPVGQAEEYRMTLRCRPDYEPARLALKEVETKIPNRQDSLKK